MKLPSGAELKVTLAPFDDAKVLSQCFLKEMRGVKIDGAMEIDYNFVKDIICTALYSPEIEVALWQCMKRATYNGLKIDKETFEPEEARQDYVEVCKEVALKNVAPFTKNLSVGLSQVMELVTQNSPK